MENLRCERVVGIWKTSRERENVPGGENNLCKGMGVHMWGGERRGKRGFETDENEACPKPGLNPYVLF